MRPSGCATIWARSTRTGPKKTGTGTDEAARAGGCPSWPLRFEPQQRTPPERWAELLADVTEFVDALIADTASELGTWDAEAALVLDG